MRSERAATFHLGNEERRVALLPRDKGRIELLAVRIKVRVSWIPRKVAPNATWGPFGQPQGEGLGSCIKISAVAD